jgi:mRNA interferase RelE/StbE
MHTWHHLVEAMGYNLIFSRTWEKEYGKLDTKTKGRVAEALHRLIEAPYSGKPLVGTLRGAWSLRVGGYRILYEIKETTKEIFIEAIGPRKNIYKRI